MDFKFASVEFLPEFALLEVELAENEVVVDVVLVVNVVIDVTIEVVDGSFTSFFPVSGAFLFWFFFLDVSLVFVLESPFSIFRALLQCC